MLRLTEKVKRITIFNAKGGVGKTAITAGLSLSYGFGIVTNDQATVLSEIFKKRLLILSSGNKLPKFHPETPLVFDFGGFMDKRILQAIKLSEVILIPVLPYQENLRMTLDLIHEIRAMNRNIIVIVNNTVKNDFARVRDSIAGHFIELRILELKRSSLFRRMIEEKKSPGELVSTHPKFARFFQPVADQFEAIFQQLSCQKHSR